jgi:hypothetical protein
MKKLIAATGLALVLGFLIRQIVVYVPLIRLNRRRIAAARQFAPVLERRIASLNGSSAVDVTWSTSGEGTVIVHGQVSSPTVIAAISNAIVGLNPSVPLRAQLTVTDPGERPTEWNWNRQRTEKD